MSGLCADCKYWRELKHDGLCVLHSNRDNGPDDEAIESATSLEATASGHYDYSVDFITSPHFGCTEFKARGQGA